MIETVRAVELIGVNRDGHNQSTKTLFDSSVKIFKRERKLPRFRDLQITSKLKVSVKENEVATEKNFGRASIFATKASYISN